MMLHVTQYQAQLLRKVCRALKSPQSTLTRFEKVHLNAIHDEIRHQFQLVKIRNTRRRHRAPGFQEAFPTLDVADRVLRRKA